MENRDFKGIFDTFMENYEFNDIFDTFYGKLKFVVSFIFLWKVKVFNA